MRVLFKISDKLLDSIYLDLRRPHAFAAERVGFISCRAARLSSDGILLLAVKYLRVEDDHYVDDPRVGARISSKAFLGPLQLAFSDGASITHVHLHEWVGIPSFSRVDARESGRFMPDFVNVRPTVPHCALVLSRDAANGKVWHGRNQAPIGLTDVHVVGSSMRSVWIPHATET